MAKMETELKYKVDRLPEEAKTFMYMEQVYFNPQNTYDFLVGKFGNLDFKTISTYRFRMIKSDNRTRYVLTLKTKGQLSRLEYEKAISKEDYEYLKKQQLLSEIIKRRYVVKEKGLTFEFDEYLNLSCPLVTCEVELNQDDIMTKEEVIKAVFDNKFKIKYVDVSLDPKYKNSNLIKYFGNKKEALV